MNKTNKHLFFVLLFSLSLTSICHGDIPVKYFNTAQISFVEWATLNAQVELNDNLIDEGAGLNSPVQIFYNKYTNKVECMFNLKNKFFEGGLEERIEDMKFLAKKALQTITYHMGELNYKTDITVHYSHVYPNNSVFQGECKNGKFEINDAGNKITFEFSKEDYDLLKMMLRIK